MYERLTINSVKRQLGLPVPYRRRPLDWYQRVAKRDYGRLYCRKCAYDYTQTSGMESKNPEDPWVEMYDCRIRQLCSNCDPRFRRDHMERLARDASLYELRKEPLTYYYCDSP